MTSLFNFIWPTLFPFNQLLHSVSFQLAYCGHCLSRAVSSDITLCIQIRHTSTAGHVVRHVEKFGKLHVGSPQTLTVT